MFPNAVGDGVNDGVNALGLVAGQLHRLSRGPAPEVPKEKKPGPCLTDLFEDRENNKGRWRPRI